ALPTGVALLTTDTRVELPAQGFAVYRVGLQVTPHGIHDENRIFRPPGCRRRAEQPILPRTTSQGRDARIHPARVGFDDGALLRWRLLHHRLRDLAEVKQACLAILFYRNLAEQLGELAPGQPPREIHFEEPILPMHEARSVSQVNTVGRGDGRS